MSATRLASVLVDELIRGGVRAAVCAPGSRNAPLTLALHAAERAGRLGLHVRVDERSAAFTALGLAKASGLPVPVVTTSGTAVAELHPAVLEAHHSGVALLAVSADRPGRLRGTGANQTTEQTQMFGAAASFVELVDGDHTDEPSWRAAVCRALAHSRRGPVQINVCLDEPLLPAADNLLDWPAQFGAAESGRPDGQPWTRVDPPDQSGTDRSGTDQSGTDQSGTATRAVLPAEQRTVLLAGDAEPAVGAAARELAEAHGWPVLAEPSSNARAGANALATYRLLLGARTGAAADLRDRIERVLVVGHPTLSRPVTRLLADPSVEVVAVAEPRTGRWTDVAGTASRVLTGLPTVTRSAGRSDRRWLDRWRAADAQVAGRLAELVGHGRGRLTGLAVAALAAGAAARVGQLLVGSSNPVRDLDLAPVWPAAAAPRVLANRGLAGIDGLVSTAVGVALAGGPTLALLGDLTFLHDANGLLLGRGETPPHLRVVVANDDGGSIFHGLEPGAPAFADAYERVFGTPHGVDLAARSAALGIRHVRADSAATLAQALAEPVRGIDVVEVPLPRDDRRALDEQVRASAEGLPA